MRTVVRLLIVGGTVAALAAPVGAAKVKAADDFLVSEQLLGEMSLIEETATDYEPVPSGVPECEHLAKAFAKAESTQKDFAFEAWADGTQSVFFSQNARVFRKTKGAKQFFKAFSNSSQVDCLTVINQGQGDPASQTPPTVTVERLRTKVKGADGVVAYRVEVVRGGPTASTFYAQYAIVRYENATLDTFFGSVDSVLFENGSELILEGVREAVDLAD